MAQQSTLGPQGVAAGLAPTVMATLPVVAARLALEGRLPMVWFGGANPAPVTRLAAKTVKAALAGPSCTACPRAVSPRHAWMSFRCVLHIAPAV